METRWYRQRKPIDLACTECNDFFTPNVEFVLLHYKCALKYITLEQNLRELGKTIPEVQKLVDELDASRKKG